MRWSFALVPFLALSLFAEEATPSSVAALVLQTDESALAEPLTAALRAPAPLVRATAARVIAVRGVLQLLPLVRETLAAETDATAAREQIRALTLLGGQDDIAFAVKSSAQWPQGMDNALAIAGARRGGVPAIDTYAAFLRKTRMSNHAEFFRVALWGHVQTLAFAGSRIVGAVDEPGWRGLLAALTDSQLAMNAGVMASSLGSPSEDIRSASVWFLIRGYASEPSLMGEVVKDALAKPREELSSNREDFGRELLRRMLGGEKKDDPRWLRFLESTEADDLVEGEVVLQYLTDDEYGIRYNRCEVQSKVCEMPKKRRNHFTIPSQAVAPPSFNLPELLPAGLADAVMSGAKCRDAWLGVAEASVDQAGRVGTLDLGKINTTSACKRALDTVLHLSMATNTSLRSGFTGPVLLAGSSRTGLCIDENTPDATDGAIHRTGGAVQAPQVTRRVEPNFPASARQSMGAGRNVIVIVESVISATGCVRNLRILSQSPYPEINGAAIMAISQWKFRPGYLDGKPVDVIFNLTINFKTQ
jgi:TonB family protein